MRTAHDDRSIRPKQNVHRIEKKSKMTEKLTVDDQEEEKQIAREVRIDYLVFYTQEEIFSDLIIIDL